MKKFFKIGGIVLGALLLVIIFYFLYVLISYHRVEDNLILDVEGEAVETLSEGAELSLITYNIGFGAYSADYSFFMDGGEHSRAFSKEAVVENTTGAMESVLKEKADFVLFQEVDTKGTRSYNVNQKEMLLAAFPDYDGVFGENYDSPYFLYPITEPIGKNRSGQLTLSRFEISDARRKSLPVEDSLYKLFDLDRAYTASVIKTEGGKELVLYNVHLSAYTSDGTIAADQLEILCSDMQSQYENGNYVIAAGDFNKDLLGDSSLYFERSEGEFNWAAPFEAELLPDGFSVHTGSNVPTCRNADSPFRGDGTDFVLSVDGLIISPNVELISCETVDLGFAYSDHNPVMAKFSLSK